jgi:hypothetical protein
MLIFVGLHVLGEQNQMQSNLLFKFVFWTIQELMLLIFLPQLLESQFLTEDGWINKKNKF